VPWVNIKNNDIYKIGLGMYLVNMENATVGGNNSENNYIVFDDIPPNTPNSYVGIRLLGGKDNYISENSVWKVVPNPPAPSLVNRLMGISCETQVGTKVMNNVTARMGTGIRFFNS